MFEDVCACMLINCLNSTIPYYLNALLNSEEKRKNNSHLEILLSFLKTQETNVVCSNTRLINCSQSLKPNKFDSNISINANLSQLAQLIFYPSHCPSLSIFRIKVFININISFANSAVWLPSHNKVRLSNRIHFRRLCFFMCNINK